jgi:hypothetical protein
LGHLGIPRYAGCRVTRVPRGWKSPSRSFARANLKRARNAQEWIEWRNFLSLSLSLSFGNVNAQLAEIFSAPASPPPPRTLLITTRGFRYNATYAFALRSLLLHLLPQLPLRPACPFIRANRRTPDSFSYRVRTERREGRIYLVIMKIAGACVCVRRTRSTAVADVSAPDGRRVETRGGGGFLRNACCRPPGGALERFMRLLEIEAKRKGVRHHLSERGEGAPNYEGGGRIERSGIRLRDVIYQRPCYPRWSDLSPSFKVIATFTFTYQIDQTDQTRRPLERGTLRDGASLHDLAIVRLLEVSREIRRLIIIRCANISGTYSRTDELRACVRACTRGEKWLIAVLLFSPRSIDRNVSRNARGASFSWGCSRERAAIMHARKLSAWIRHLRNMRCDIRERERERETAFFSARGRDDAVKRKQIFSPRSRILLFAGGSGGDMLQN